MIKNVSKRKWGGGKYLLAIFVSMVLIFSICNPAYAYTGAGGGGTDPYRYVTIYGMQYTTTTNSITMTQNSSIAIWPDHSNNYVMKDIKGNVSFGGKILLNFNFTNPYHPNWGTSPYSVEIPIVATIIDGLSANTAYCFYLNYFANITNRSTYEASDGLAYNGRVPQYPSLQWNDYISTDAAIPIVSFSDIKSDRVTINWNPNGNINGTKYTLIRTIPNSTTEEVVTTTDNSYTDVGLQNETTYIYKVKVHHVQEIKYGNERNVYSSDYTVETTADPAVAAAQEAASAAQAAKTAAEATLQYSTDAKNAALAAQTASENAEKKSVEIYNIVAKLPPKVNKVYTDNNATATITQTSPPICVDADGATHFQLSLDKNNWSLPIPIDSYGNINLNPGFNRIYVRIYNENIPQDVRAFGTGNIGIFRLQP